MGDGRLRSPSLWDDVVAPPPPSFHYPPSPTLLVARNLAFSREEIIDSRPAKGDHHHASIDYHYRSSSEMASPRSRRPRVVVRKFPLSVIVKRQCAVAPLGPPSLHPRAAAPGTWNPAKVLLRISESDGVGRGGDPIGAVDQHAVETDAWAFNEHDSPLSLSSLTDGMEDERHPHLMESSEDPSLFTPGGDDDVFGDHVHCWGSWIKEEEEDEPEEQADIPDAPEDLQCPMDDLDEHHLQHVVQPAIMEAMEEPPLSPMMGGGEEALVDAAAAACGGYEDEESPMAEVVERSLLIHGAELAQPSRTIDTGYPCPEKNCQSVLSSLTALRKHKLVHAPKIFACSMCDRAFAERTKLNRHERSHTGEKPFKCPVPGCAKVFAHNFNLNSHLKLHNDERPFVCGVCGRSFAKNSNLRVHAVTHTRSKLSRPRRTRNH